MRLRIIGALVTAAALIAPATALGNTYCVYQSPNPDPPPPCDGLYPKLQDALSAAQSRVGPDTVRIGAGTFVSTTSGGHFYGGYPDPIDVVGAGPATRLRRDDAGPVLTVLSTPRSTISNLTVVPLAGGNAGAVSVGIRASNSTITSVTVDPANATQWVTGFDLEGGELNDVTALFSPTTTGTTGATLVGHPASPVAVARSSLSGTEGLFVDGPSVSVDQTRISARAAGIQTNSDVSIANSLIRVTPAGANQFGVYVDSSKNTDVFARNVTIVGDGATASSAGIYTRAYIAAGSVAVNVNVNSSIVRGFTNSFSKVASDVPPYTATANVVPKYSDFPPTATGAYTPDASNVNVDPGFVPGDYTLAPGSPVVDTRLPGTISAGGGSGTETDLVGNLRVVDGDGDGSARRDIGAFEYRPPAPPGGGPGAPGGAGDPGAGGPGAGGPGAGGPTAAVTALTLSPTRFRAAASGPAVTAAAKKKRRPPRGTTVTFTLTQAGSAAFAIERKTTGRRSGNQCVKATRRNRKARQCTRYVAVKKSAFTRSGVGGANKFRLMGRLGRKALAPGGYRLVATVGASSRSAPFTVIR
jgi:hypothetical protein